MMKGFVFTLDAIFALAVAAMGITLLLYFHYSMQTPSTFGYSSASSLLSTLSSTNIGNVTSNGILSQMQQHAEGANDTWPQLAKNNAHSGVSAYGPTKPMLSFVFAVGSAITSPPVADYSTVYFAAGNVIYAVNATTGTLKWSRNVGTSVSSVAAYSGMLIYVNTTSIGALNAVNSMKIWSAAAPGVSSPLLVYDGKVIFGETNSYVYSLYASNGTTAWSNYTASNSIAVSSVAGQVAARLANNKVVVLDTVGTAAKQVTSISPSSASTYLASTGSTLFFGSGGYAAAYYINGTLAGSISSCSSPSGVAVSNGNAIFQCSGGVIGVSTGGALLWSFSQPSGLTPLTNATPAIAGNTAYTLWSSSSGDYVVAVNTTSHTGMWQALIPSSMQPVEPAMAVAYGDLYVSAGDYLLAYGACPVSGKNMLQDAATLYANGFGSCATAMLNALQPTTNYALEINGKLMPFTSSATFNGASSYIYIGPNASVESSNYTWSLWVDPTAWNANSGGFFGEANSGGGYPYMIEQSNSTTPYRLQFSNDGGASGYSTYAPLSLNKWQYVVGTYNYSTGAMNLYMDGVLVSSASSKAIVRGVGPIYIGYFPTTNLYYTGQIADVQIYNKPLTSAQIQKLYQEGIQGPPLQGSGIIAWWPLEGDANDYSSFTNTGYPFSMSYTQSSFIPSSLSNTYQVSVASTSMAIANYSTGNVMMDNVGVASWQ